MLRTRKACGCFTFMNKGCFTFLLLLLIKDLLGMFLFGEETRRLSFYNLVLAEGQWIVLARIWLGTQSKQLWKGETCQDESRYYWACLFRWLGGGPQNNPGVGYLSSFGGD